LQGAEYGPRGRVGIATPASNPTVEPEMRLLLPADIGVYATRLAAAPADLPGRLRRYLTHIPETAASFGSLAIQALGVGCTLASYLAGCELEDRLTTAAQAQLQLPVFTATQAIRRALETLGARAIALVSPYPRTLAESGDAYWTSAGFTLTARLLLDEQMPDTRAMYSLGSDDTLHAMRRIDPRGADCIVCTGTAVPSLRALTTFRRGNPLLPVVSANLCLAWTLYQAVDAARAPPTPVALLHP
jgi:maleate isomerase